jgi:HPt (histidine-containing phosphotransfer) domain-containing protein
MKVPEEILKRYLERRQKDFENCLLWVKGSNFAELERVGHQLKGNGSTFGFEELSQIGIMMEDAAKSKDIPKLELLVNDLNVWLKNKIN